MYLDISDDISMKYAEIQHENYSNIFTKSVLSLHDLAVKYPSDKLKQYGHNYIPGYEALFASSRTKATNVLEIGIGCGLHETAMKQNAPYKAGNSLRMWRDYFHNAQIYAIDIVPEGMIKGEERISTFVADQSSTQDLDMLMSHIKNPLDIIIDDGSHHWVHQCASFMYLEKHVRPGGIYVIEDVQPGYIESFKNLSIFDAEFAKLIRDNYKISWYDTRKDTGKEDDFLMCFTKK